MDISSLTLGRGFGGYFNALFATEWRWQVWAIAFVLTLVLFVLLRKRVVVFFQLYIFVTFLPVIFLINHRESFYWYFPFLGVSGLIALLSDRVASLSATIVPARFATTLGAAVFLVLCLGVYVRTRNLTEASRVRFHGIARDYYGFVSDLQQLPRPETGETLFFRSYPEYFDEEVLLPATQVALRRTDVNAKLVDDFPTNARYRLAFRNSHIIEEH
jgi:hypothetical protein